MTNKPWIAIASVSLSLAALSASPLGHAAGRMILPSGSVGTAQLKAGAVTAAKVKDGTLTAAKFKAGQFPQGPKGDAGAAGPKGDKGDAGAPGISGYELVVGASTTIPQGQADNATVQCPAGKKVIGGGGLGSNGVAIQASSPLANGEGWTAVARNSGPLSGTLRAAAVCATVG